jgi:hypothetical protein
MVLTRLNLPCATINALVQFLIPPPKYHVERLVPGVGVVTEARLASMVVLQRGGVGQYLLEPREAIETLMTNCEDAFGFPPYPMIGRFLRAGNGRELEAEERDIVAKALGRIPATLIQSETMDWWQRLPAVLNRAMSGASWRPPEPANASAVGTDASGAMNGASQAPADGRPDDRPPSGPIPATPVVNSTSSVHV